MVVVAKHRLMVNTHKEARLREIVLSGILPEMQDSINSMRRALNVQILKIY